MAAFASSYIKTEASQVTRSADAASITGSNFSGFYNQAEGTLYAEYSTATPTTARIYQVGDGTANNRMDGLMASNNFAVFVQTNSTTQVTANATGTLAANVFGKTALAYKTNDFAWLLNSGTVATDTSALVPVVSQLGIGRRLDTAAYLNGTIKRIAYYPAKLSSTQLQAITG